MKKRNYKVYITYHDTKPLEICIANAPIITNRLIRIVEEAVDLQTAKRLVALYKIKDLPEWK